MSKRAMAMLAITSITFGALILWLAIATPPTSCPRWTAAAAFREYARTHGERAYIPPLERGC